MFKDAMVQSFNEKLELSLDYTNGIVFSIYGLNNDFNFGEVIKFNDGENEVEENIIGSFILGDYVLINTMSYEDVEKFMVFKTNNQRI